MDNNAELIVKIAVLEEKLIQQREALILQAKGYERRLAALNHEAEQLKNMQVTYLNKESYELRHESLSKRVEELKTVVEKRPTWMVTSIISLLMLAIGFIVKHLVMG